ncbi:MAG: diguanylate cyclase [Campylobacterales bacterium]|nr:diguanylate cyclase [Campylobacterales bacterium]
MQLGFALVESGTVRPKNTINVAMKNLIDTIVGIIAFWLVGFGLMFGAAGYMIDGGDLTQNALFFFQAMFAATAATIVSGAVAERMKFSGYVLVAVVVTALIYPLFGQWAWSEQGWLKELGFVDFAGSTVVHSVGAWIGLAGAIALGPRLGRFRKGSIVIFSPNNHNFIVFGIFILWFAWFGFNAGSLLAFDAKITSILLNTTLAGAFGGFGGYLLSLFYKERVGVEIFSFGILSGLVGITAGCASMDAPSSALVGLVSVGVMFYSDRWLLRRWHIDDPLSVVGIHGAAGAWGTFAVALFGALPAGMDRLSFMLVQLTGIVTAFGFAFLCGLALFRLLRMANVLRVPPRHEVLGLNVSEHHARMPWVDTIEGIVKIMRTGNMRLKLRTERDTEIGIVARFVNHLLEMLRFKQEQLATQAHSDTLTALLNRRGLLERVTGKNPFNSGYSLIVIDIDHFKKINDAFGHDMGDRVLRLVSDTLKEHIRQSDLLARWGGEEFLIVASGTRIADCEALAEKLRLRIAALAIETVGTVTCSFGVSSPKNPNVTFEQLFKQADSALYQAKTLGRNRVCSY